MALPQVFVDNGDYSAVYLGQPPVFKLKQGTAGSNTVTVRGEDGNLYSFAAGDTLTVVFLETPSVTTVNLSAAATLTDVAAATVTLTVTAAQVPFPGVFKGEINVTRSGTIVDRIDSWLEVSTTLSTGASQKYNPILIKDIRTALKDRSLVENPLIGKLEWTDAEIAHCITLPVEYWNETGNSGNTYTNVTFPYRQRWRQAVIAELYILASQTIIRNKLPANIAGVNFDEDARGDFYLKLGMEMKKEFQTFIYAQKRHESLSGWMGSSRIGSFG